MRRFSKDKNLIIFLLLVSAAVITLAFRPDLAGIGAAKPNMDEIWHKVNASEELILSLMPELLELDKSLLNLQLPDHESRNIFEERLTILDLAPNGPAQFYDEFIPTVSVGVRKWQAESEARPTGLAEASLWRPFLEKVGYFESTKFQIKKGHFLNEELDEYETVVLFSGTALMKSGQINSVKSKQIVRWRKDPSLKEGKTDIWKIYDWRMKDFQTIETDRKLFKEVLDDVIVDADDIKRARTSVHEQLVIQSVVDEKNFKKPHKAFTPRALARHPGVAVVDLDQDGFDDFYVMARWGENMFFHNRGDGTFEEIATEIGLNIKDHTSSALFADFDNDGDIDVFLGRTLARCAYLVNENGFFVDHSESLVDAPLPYLSGSISAADYNDDGLLDIYISTLESRMVRQEYRRIEKLRKQNKPFNKNILGEYLPSEDAENLYQLIYSNDWHPFTNHFGPPNVLLKNVGNGRFKIVKDSILSREFRQTFQATWSDYDNDGDADVYLANDFGPNHMFRNEGNGKFIDVTEETNTADFGFGMGVTWGDYNNDGKQDLYVTNMYSKAGLRITEQIPGLDPDLAKGARGNSLFRQDATSFHRVSGLARPSLLVEVGGWSWGSQFLDVDNDGYLDIYALSGHYTAPKEIALPVDI